MRFCEIEWSARPRRTSAAFTLPEVLVAVTVAAILFLSLYAGLSSGFAVIRVARENLRATQILQEKMETIRLYTWDQLNASDFIPDTFVEPFSDYAGEGADPDGINYYGTLTITNALLAESYAADILQVNATVMWTSGNIERTRDMSTLVSRYGLQHYIY